MTSNALKARSETVTWNVMVVGFLAIAGFFLFTEHRAHFFGVLPYVLLLLCPFLHFFGHRGHGGHGGHEGHGRPASGGPS